MTDKSQYCTKLLLLKYTQWKAYNRAAHKSVVEMVILCLRPCLSLRKHLSFVEYGGTERLLTFTLEGWTRWIIYCTSLPRIHCSTAWLTVLENMRLRPEQRDFEEILDLRSTFCRAGRFVFETNAGTLKMAIFLPIPEHRQFLWCNKHVSCF